jgi:hypothetical protein
MSSLPIRSLQVAATAALLTLSLAACSGGSDNVSCSGSTCTATLSGGSAKANILGSTLAFAGTENGRATLSVGNARVSCAQGESVSAGPLTLTCTTVTDESVQLTARLG